MKFEFNSNTVMAVIMFITLLGGGYGYIENQIKVVNDKVEEIVIPDAYDDDDLASRVNKLEEANLDSKVQLIIQKVDSIKPFDPSEMQKTLNEVKIDLATLQTELTNLKGHDHNGTYIRKGEPNG